MQLRAKRQNTAKQARQLMAMRNGVRAELGEKYRASVIPFEPYIRAELPRNGCTITAANRIIEQLRRRGEDLAVQRLIACAAIELALAS